MKRERVAIHSARPYHRQDGAFTVETAVALTFFAIFILAFLNLSLLAFRAASLEWVLSHTARYAATGQSAVEEFADQTAHRFGFSLAPDDVTICLELDPNCTTDASLEPDVIFLIRATITVPFIGAGSDYTYTAHVVGRTEPYDV